MTFATAPPLLSRRKARVSAPRFNRQLRFYTPPEETTPLPPSRPWARLFSSCFLITLFESRHQAGAHSPTGTCVPGRGRKAGAGPAAASGARSSSQRRPGLRGAHGRSLPPRPRLLSPVLRLGAVLPPGGPFAVAGARTRLQRVLSRAPTGTRMRFLPGKPVHSGALLVIWGIKTHLDALERRLCEPREAEQS